MSLRRVLLVWLFVVVPCWSAAAKTRQVAVVMGRSHPRFQAAIQGMKRIPGVIPNVFDLSRGTTEVDRALDALRRFPFDAVVALGRQGHDFCVKSGHKRPYAAALVADSKLVHPDILDPRPGAEDWVRVFQKILPKKARIGAFVSCDAEAACLEELADRLQSVGMRLEVGRLEPGRSPTRVVREILEGRRVQAVFLPEDWGLLRQREALFHLLQRAHKRMLPVFSESTARRWAVLSLFVPDEVVGELAVRRCLGLPMDTGTPSVRVEANLERAEALRIKIPPAVLRGEVVEGQARRH